MENLLITFNPMVVNSLALLIASLGALTLVPTVLLARRLVPVPVSRLL